jgi:hypothetical protein
MNLQLTDGHIRVQQAALTDLEGLESKPGMLTQTAPPSEHSPNHQGVSTHQFKGKKAPDYAILDAANRKLGSAGERLVIEHEKRVLLAAGRPDLAAQVRHVAELEGDGAGYDVLSFNSDGEKKFIEVKTTRGDASADFYVSRNELAFSESHCENYVLYRVFNYEPEKNTAEFCVAKGPLNANGFRLVPVQYRVTR